MTLDRISIEVTNRCAKACWFCYNEEVSSDCQSVAKRLKNSPENVSSGCKSVET
jgi:hypothetical protein